MTTRACEVQSVQLDVARLADVPRRRPILRDRAARGSAGSPRATSYRAAHARAAIARYRGDFMPGLYHEWVLAVAKRAAGVLRAALRPVVEAMRADGRGCRRGGRRPPACPARATRRGGLPDLMELQIEAGDRAGAISTFHRCAELLERELDCSPDPATSAIVERLGAAPRRDGREASRPRSPPTRRRARAAHRAGRELASLIRLWRGRTSVTPASRWSPVSRASARRGS